MSRNLLMAACSVPLWTVVIGMQWVQFSVTDRHDVMLMEISG